MIAYQPIMMNVKIRMVMACSMAFSACTGGMSGRQPPEKIVAAFDRMYPQAHVTKWNDEPPIWEAKYTLGTMSGAVSFDANAEVTETELVIPENQLRAPLSVHEYITAHYPKERIQHCELVTKQNGTVTYEIQITGKELVFDAQGAFLQEEPD